MVVLCLTYSIRSFVLPLFLGVAAFHVAGICTQLVDLPNRSILYSKLLMRSRLIQGFTKSLLCIFPYWYVMDCSRDFVDIIKLSFVFIISLVTCIGSSSRHVLYIKLLNSKPIYIVVYFITIGNL